MNALVEFFLKNRLFVFIFLIMLIGAGIATAPFNWDIEILPRDPIPVDAIPDIGENQQIVITEWEGQSPQDIEDQITYPLTTTLLGLPKVKTIRSTSMFGLSFIYIIFEEDADFYWCRERILEKLNSLPKGLLPEGIMPKLGPDATGLGQVFWYTLEGRDREGEPNGGWNLDELRTIQEFYVKPALSSVEGVSEVASVGGHLKEYIVWADPQKLRYYNIGLKQVADAIKKANKTIGAQTTEINLVEYFVRGFGYVQNVEDIRKAVVKYQNGTPIKIEDIGFVTEGPAPRRGILDKEGSEAVGGVVIARYGENPMKVIQKVKEKIKQIAPSLPKKVLKDGSISKVTIVPFYDRTDLIKETLGTLNEALYLQLLVTFIVIIYLLSEIRSVVVIMLVLPLSILGVFIMMKIWGIPANIVSLSGIAIAIGTLVDMGIVLTENVVKHLQYKSQKKLIDRIYEASKEVIPPLVTSASTTIISFLPVFALQASEGKLFKPLAFTKTFALVMALILAIIVLPAITYLLFKFNPRRKIAMILSALLTILSIYIWIKIEPYTGIVGTIFGVVNFIALGLENKVPEKYINVFKNVIYIGVALYFLSGAWLPLGTETSLFINFVFVTLAVLPILFYFSLIVKVYEYILRFLLRFRYVFLVVTILLVVYGYQIMRKTPREFMPALDEGSFLLMPIALPHAGTEVIQHTLRILDMAVYSIPEVQGVLGKAGRVESAVDPAPLSMYENIILYKSEYVTDENGQKIKFKVDKDGHFFVRYKNKLLKYDRKTQKFLPYKDTTFFNQISESEFIHIEKNIGKYLVPDDKGKYFRQWRDHIKTPDDIWKEIEKVSKLPWITPSPKLQPIQTRIIMLQTGMRSPIGIKVMGPDLKTIEQFGLKLEKILQTVEGVSKPTVYAERVVGKPYLTIKIDREALVKYGLKVSDVMDAFKMAAGGKVLTYTVEGRERYGIRLRYPRELRNYPKEIGNILIKTPEGYHIELREVADITYEAGPQAIKSENSFLTSYVFFDSDENHTAIQAVENVQKVLKEKIESGELEVPAGVSYVFEGEYQNQLRANRRLAIVIPVALIIIFLILYLQFRDITTSLIVFSAVAVAFSGGFIMMELYSQEWFLNFSLFGQNLREIMKVVPVNLSVAVWVGFLALFGIATDDGVLISSLIQQKWAEQTPKTLEEIRETIVSAGKLRVRPAIMTTATTLLALLPVLTSTGRGSEIMKPMAIPIFGGMLLATLTIFTVPVITYIVNEIKIKLKQK